jgi:2,4-diketo-3-deoxy-L-fuconate hydrolase
MVTPKRWVFSARHFVSFSGKFVRLLPGDVIATGAPSDAGFAMMPPQFVNPGDVMHPGVEKLGEQPQTCLACPG